MCCGYHKTDTNIAVLVLGKPRPITLGVLNNFRLYWYSLVPRRHASGNGNQRATRGYTVGRKGGSISRTQRIEQTSIQVRELPLIGCFCVLKSFSSSGMTSSWCCMHSYFELCVLWWMRTSAYPMLKCCSAHDIMVRLFVWSVLRGSINAAKSAFHHFLSSCRSPLFCCNSSGQPAATAALW